jgi:hypothetical protein
MFLHEILLSDLKLPALLLRGVCFTPVALRLSVDDEKRWEEERRGSLRNIYVISIALKRKTLPSREKSVTVVKSGKKTFQPGRFGRINSQGG